MNDKKKQLKEQMQQLEGYCERIREIAETCEKEKRSRNEAEEKEYRELSALSQLAQMKIQSRAAEILHDEPDTKIQADSILRENIKAGRQTEIKLMREFVMVSDATAGGIIPVKVQDIIEPLAEGLILDKVGLPFLTGLAGDYVWPVYEAAEATIAGESVALTDTVLELSQLTAQPQRIGIAIPVTRETIMQTEGIIETIIRRLMPKSVSLLINKIMLGTDKVAGATTLKGPFVDLKATAKVIPAEPTYRDLVELKSDVLVSGVDGEHLCFVMTQGMKAILEATPKDAGSGIMICENDMIAGVPVFTSHYIGETYIGIGDWRYQPLGLFGNMDFIVDPYSKARNNAIEFVLNANFGTTTLQAGAFKLAKATGVSA